MAISFSVISARAASTRAVRLAPRASSLRSASAAPGAFDGAQTVVERGERAAQAVQRIGGAALGVGQSLAKAADHLVDQRRGIGSGGGGFGARQAGVDGRQFLTGAGLAGIDVVGDAGHRLLEHAQGLGRARAGGLGLQPAQTVGDPRLLGAHMVHGAVEALGHGHMLALAGLDARDGGADGMLDAGDRQAGPGLGGLDPVGQSVQRIGDAGEVVGPAVGARRERRDRRAGHQARPLRLDRRRRRALRAVDELVLGGHVLRYIIFKDDAIQPLAEGHARTPGEVLRDLAGLRVNPLDAPGRARGHRIVLQVLRGAYAPIPGGVNATLTLHIASGGSILWMFAYNSRGQTSDLPATLRYAVAHEPDTDAFPRRGLPGARPLRGLARRAAA
ncbi:hypothetical protein [Phenylobacterium sp. J367]|uniref:hypothetical protein n=1 Tax=Phenylobacterium sp. J367 TaxID=2898435 RepID=UPI002150CE56|nr:hypothetical protein [Phenylobacterium sp. J367]MCR5878756.1 hypothetical protein [Phenylobacterium sp. J367]